MEIYVLGAIVSLIGIIILSYNWYPDFYFYHFDNFLDNIIDFLMRISIALIMSLIVWIILFVIFNHTYNLNLHF